MNTKAIVKEYFGKHWTSRTSTYRYSSCETIASKIATHETVIDVGCGNNEFKPHIKHLTGIDLVNPAADICVDLDEYEPDQLFDVAICLGVIQYGDENDITRQIAKVGSILKPSARIYWRSNMAVRDHKHEMVNLVPYYPWSIDEHHRFARMFGWTIDFIDEDLYGRLYAEWRR